MLPASGRSSPPIRLSSVLLPAPDRPSSTTSSDSFTSMSTPTRASTRRPVLKCFDTCRTTAASGMVGVSRVGRQDRDVVLLQAEAHALLQGELFDVRARKLDPPRAVHDHQLLRDERLMRPRPPRLGRRLPVADLDDA